MRHENVIIIRVTVNIEALPTVDTIAVLEK